MLIIHKSWCSACKGKCCAPFFFFPDPLYHFDWRRANTLFCRAVTSILSQRLLHKMTNSRPAFIARIFTLVKRQNLSLCYTVKLFRETATRRSFTNGCYTTQCIHVFCCRRCTSRTRFYFSWNCRASGMRKGFMNPTVLHGAIVGETCLALQFHEKVSPCNIGFSKETQYLASILSDTFVKRICRDKGCAPGKRSLQTRWNVTSTFTDTHVHGDERWPIMEVTSNTYFRGVTLFC